MTLSPTRLFSVSCVLLLLVIGGAKLGLLFKDYQFLATADPIFGIRYGSLLPLVGFAEVGLGAALLFPTEARLLSLASFSLGLAIYRFGLWSLSYHKPCGCLGALSDYLHFDPIIVDRIMLGVIAYLLCGSLLARHYFARFQPVQIAS